MQDIEEATRRLYDYADAATSHTLPRSAASPRARTTSFNSGMRSTKKIHPDLAGYRYPIRTSPRRRPRRDGPVSPAPSGKVYTRISPKRKAVTRNGVAGLFGTLINPVAKTLARKRREIVKKDKGKTSLAFWKSHSTGDVRNQSALEPLDVEEESVREMLLDEPEEEYDEEYPNGPAQYLTMPSTSVENPFATPTRPESLQSCAMSDAQSPPLSPSTNSLKSFRSTRSSIIRRKSEMKAVQLLGPEACSSVKFSRPPKN